VKKRVLQFVAVA